MYKAIVNYRKDDTSMEAEIFFEDFADALEEIADIKSQACVESVVLYEGFTLASKPATVWNVIAEVIV